MMSNEICVLAAVFQEFWVLSRMFRFDGQSTSDIWECFRTFQNIGSTWVIAFFRFFRMALKCQEESKLGGIDKWKVLRPKVWNSNPIPLPMTWAFNSCRFWPKRCSTTPPSRTSTSVGIGLVIGGSRPGSWNSQFPFLNFTFCTWHCRLSPMQWSTTRPSSISTWLRILLALPVARPGESLGPKSLCSLAPLCERSKSRNASRRTRKLLKRLLGCGLGVLAWLVLLVFTSLDVFNGFSFQLWRFWCFLCFEFRLLTA